MFKVSSLLWVVIALFQLYLSRNSAFVKLIGIEIWYIAAAESLLIAMLLLIIVPPFA